MEENLSYGYFNIVDKDYVLSLTPYFVEKKKTRKESSTSLSLTKDTSKSNFDSLTFLISYTNTIDEYYECDITNDVLKKLKGELSWKTFFHQLENGIMNPKDDFKEFEDDSKDILNLKIGKYEFELYAIRNEKEKTKKKSNLIMNLINKTKENKKREIELEEQIENLQKENEKLKQRNQSTSESDTTFDYNFGDDQSEGKPKEKKKRKVKSLMNPSQKRHKPSGAKIL
eukprot:gene11838-5168_t